MELTVRRIYRCPEYTVGKLYIGGSAYLCDTLEDAERDLNKPADKVYGRTAIPRGRYRVLVTWSPKFRKFLPLVCNVPYFEGIRIHAGNTAEDTEGCLLVGENTEKGRLANSRLWAERVCELLKAAERRGEKNFIMVE